MYNKGKFYNRRTEGEVDGLGEIPVSPKQFNLPSYQDLVTIELCLYFEIFSSLRTILRDTLSLDLIIHLLIKS